MGSISSEIQIVIADDHPIFREGLDHWRHYEPWLGPLKESLGPVLEAYPEIPASF